MFPLPPLPSININIGGGHQHGPQGACNSQGPQGPCGQQGGPRGHHPMQRMMRKLQRMMAQLQGGQQNQGCCGNSRPQFGNCCGGQQQGGFSFQMGASIRGFLG